MKQHGAKLKAIAKAKGYTISQLSDQLKVSRIIVERNFKAETLTRKVLSKYANLLGFSVDEFYNDSAEPMAKEAKESGSTIEQLQREVIYWQRKYIELQERFFPSAVIA